MIRHFLATTLGQILTIIATSSALTLLLFLALLTLLFPSVPPPPPWPWPAAYRIVSLIESLRLLPPAERAAIALAAGRPGLAVRLTQAPAICPGLTRDARELEAVLIEELDEPLPEITARACDLEVAGADIQVLARLDGEVLEFRAVKSEGTRFRHLTFPFVGALLFLCVAVTAMSAWAIWRVIGPLRRLSARADAFGQSIAAEPIAEEGPLEIRRVARTFNRMQERITRSIHERTRMLAAIGHDLRTPLTRMRLQLETGRTEPGRTELVRGKLLRDVGLMQSMVTSALIFLSGGFDGEEKEWLDLGALLATLCDEHEEGGSAVGYHGPEQIRFFCRPNAITRALTNLVENALHHGDQVTVTATAGDGHIAIEVADDGPGIPEDRLHDVTEPFVRLDPSRAGRPGSVGLGLSIVKEIVAAHGGTLDLRNRRPHGLVARVQLAAPPSPRP